MSVTYKLIFNLRKNKNLGTLEVNIMKQNKADTHQSKPIIAFYQTRLTSSANLSNKWAYLFIMWTYEMHISKRE